MDLTVLDGSGESDLKGHKSSVWKSFTSKTTTQKGKHGFIELIKTATCNICSKTFEIKRGNTSNLWTHLENHHYAEYAKYKTSSKPEKKSASASGNIIDIFKKMTPYAKGSVEYGKRTEAVVKYICQDTKPLSTIDSPSFRALLHTFDPRYNPPSRTTISDNHIPAMYYQVKSGIQARIRSAKLAHVPVFSFTTDAWSSVTLEPYLSLTIHFIDQDWNFVRFTLENRYVPDPKTGINLALVINDLLELWDLDVKDVSCITTDSAANMIKMAEEGRFPRIPCFGHLLHNGIKEAMKPAQECTKKLREIVAYFHVSFKRQKKLDEEMVKAGKRPVTMLADCQTRWGSTFKMYKLIHDHLTEIKRVIVEDSARLVPSVDDELMIKTVVEALADYEEMTDALSGDTSPTAGEVLPLLQIIGGLRYGAISPKAREFRNQIYDYISRKYSPVSERLKVSNVSFMFPISITVTLLTVVFQAHHPFCLLPSTIQRCHVFSYVKL